MLVAESDRRVNVDNMLLGRERMCTSQTLAFECVLTSSILCRVRHSMAKGIMGGMPKYVADANLAVYRKHVESGLLMEKPKYRRK